MTRAETERTSKEMCYAVFFLLNRYIVTMKEWDEALVSARRVIAESETI